MPRLLIIFFGLAAWWLLVPLERYLAADGWRLISIAIPILAVVLGILGACFRLRKNALGILLWSPLFVLCCWILLAVTPAFFGELRVGGLSGGPAPLAGAAMLLILSILIVTGVVFVFCIVSFPREINWGLLGVSLANSAAIAFTIWHTAETEARQIIAVKVLDSANRPVEAARITYQVYGYGPGGTRPQWPEISGGPAFTDKSGIVQIRSERIRHEVLIDVSKEGYQTIQANLGMQFYDYDDFRDLVLKIGAIDRAAWIYVSTKEPLQISLYLPTLAEAARPLKKFEIKERFTLGPESTRFLSVSTGRFTADPDKSDLRFDISDRIRSDKLHESVVKITALHGSGLVQVPLPRREVGTFPSYSAIMKIAPQEGYSSECTLTSSLRDPVYFRSADGTLYGCLVFDMVFSGETGSEGRLYGALLVSSSNSRNFLLILLWKPVNDDLTIQSQELVLSLKSRCAGGGT